MIGMGALYGARKLSAGKQLPDDDAFNTGLVVNSRAYSPATAEGLNPLYQTPDDSVRLV